MEGLAVLINNVSGWVGMALLIAAYTQLKRNKSLFVVLDIIATGFLLLHAVVLHDVPFIVVQAIVLLLLFDTKYNGGKDAN